MKDAWLLIPNLRQEIPTGGEDCPYQTSAVDLRLGREISYFREGLALDINLQRGGFARLFGPNSRNTATHGRTAFCVAAQQTRVGQDA